MNAAPEMTPAARPPPAPTPAEPASAPRPRGRAALIVEDDPALREMLALNLQRAGFRTFAAADGPGALREAAARRPDVVLLDCMLPGLGGAEVAARLRAHPDLHGVPIIMVTARVEEVDELLGLAVGADDYLTKPFSVKVLLARIEAVLRRGGRAPGPAGAPRRLGAGEVEIDLETHEARAAGHAVQLTLTEFRILAALLGARRRVLTRRELVGAAMGPGVTITERTIDVHITAIRRKLGEHGGIVRTVRGVGYGIAGE